MLNKINGFLYILYFSDLLVDVCIALKWCYVILFISNHLSINGCIVWLYGRVARVGIDRIIFIFSYPISGRISYYEALPDIRCPAGYEIQIQQPLQDIQSNRQFDIRSIPSDKVLKRTWKLGFNSMQQACEILEVWFHSSRSPCICAMQNPFRRALLLLFSWLMPTFGYFHWIIN